MEWSETRRVCSLATEAKTAVLPENWAHQWLHWCGWEAGWITTSFISLESDKPYSRLVAYTLSIRVSRFSRLESRARRMSLAPISEYTSSIDSGSVQNYKITLSVYLTVIARTGEVVPTTNSHRRWTECSAKWIVVWASQFYSFVLKSNLFFKESKDALSKSQLAVSSPHTCWTAEKEAGWRVLLSVP